MGLESATLITEGPLPFFPPDLSQRILTPKGARPAAPRPTTVSRESRGEGLEVSYLVAGDRGAPGGGSADETGCRGSAGAYHGG